MTKAQDLRAKADEFAARAAIARFRTQRNTLLSLERSCRALAELSEAIGADSPTATIVPFPPR